MNWLLCPNSWSVLVAAGLAPVVVERVVVPVDLPKHGVVGEGISSWENR